MSRWWPFSSKETAKRSDALETVRHLRASHGALSDDDLKTAGARATTLPDVVAVTAEAARRVLGLEMFDVQLQGALALARGSIVEMQTGEGKTLAAVPAIVWHARGGDGVHVLTANDYLARRDAAWMGGIYDRPRALGGRRSSRAWRAEERRAAYGCDVTYATANEGRLRLPPRPARPRPRASRSTARSPRPSSTRPTRS